MRQSLSGVFRVVSRQTWARFLCVVLTLGLFGAGGCETKAGTGAIIGGLGGALVGGAIGSHSHARAGEGALIGGVVGAAGGALIGHGMDKDDQRAREAKVTTDYDKHYDAYGHRR